MRKLFKLSAYASLPLFVFALSACSVPAPSSPGTTSPSSSPEKTTTGWPEENREAYLRECLNTSGGLTSYCECSLEEVEKAYTLEEMADLERRITEDLSAVGELQEILEFCVSEAQ